MIRRTLLTFAAAIALLVPAALAQAPTRFFVTVTGKGPDVILIPGLASSGAVWDATVKQLAATRRVHVLQVNGFAGSAPGANAEGPLLQSLVNEAADYAAHLNHPAIIGHSLGGLMALEVAVQHPQSIGRVLIVDALPFYSLLFGPMATSRMVEPQAAAMRDQLIAQSDAQFSASETGAIANLVKSEAPRPTVLDWALRSDRRTVAMAMYEDMVTDVRADLGMINAPTTVLYAYDSQMGQPAAAVDALYGSAYAGLANVKLHRIDGSYHFIMLDQPAAFAREVEAFLR
jgi:pimeloyl-ACP methyl ester carboxylesterase